MESKKNCDVTDDLWLHYFNQYLFEHTVITESERNKMSRLIHQRRRGIVRRSALNALQ